jgi:hypothetical protein
MHLHLSAQQTWPQLYACLSSIICPFSVSSHPQLGQENQERKKAHSIEWLDNNRLCGPCSLS